MMTAGVMLGQRALSFEGTWPPVTTWRGFTLSIAEGLYVFWVMSAPLLSFVTCLELGLFFLALLGIRSVLLRRWLIDPGGDPATSTNDLWRERYAPITYFFHRNYGLHVSAAYALMGADKLGALVLLAIGAVVDVAREKRMRSGYYVKIRKPELRLRSVLGWLNFLKDPPMLALVLFIACSIVLYAIWNASIPNQFFLMFFDRYSELMTHFQSAIGNHPLAGSDFPHPVDLFKYRVLFSVFLAVSFWLCSFHASNSIDYFIFSGGRMPFYVPSSILSALLLLSMLVVGYFIFLLPLIQLGHVLNGDIRIARTWRFTFDLAAIMLFSQIFIVIHFLGYFTVLTRSRAGDQTPKW